MSSSRRSRHRRSKVDLSTVNANTELALVDDLAPEERRASTSGRYSPTLLLVALLASIGVFAYTAFILTPAFRGDLIPWLIVMTCELILIFQASMALWTMLSGYGRQPSYRFQTAQAKLFNPQLNARMRITADPTKWPMYLNDRQVDVDVLITVYGEPLDVIETTARAAMAMHGRHITWILDDGDSDEVRDLAKSLGCRYVRRLGSSGAKAGNINNALSVAKAEFFVIFDADFVAKPDFLYETVPFMEDSNVAFVQTPQVYGNLNNIVSRGAGFIQMVFYRFIQPGRNEFNAAFCVGTNVLFRRAAVKDIGGIYTQSKSEDIWTSILMHERGWRSIFQPKELAIGDTPDTIESYSKQQLRWATGGFEILFTHNPLSPRRRLRMDQRIMYFATCTFYFTGIAPGLLMLVPILEVFFDLRPVTLAVKWYEWALFYPGFYAGGGDRRYLPLGGPPAGSELFPDLHQGFLQRLAQSGHEVVGNRRDRRQGIGLQLHDGAGLGIRFHAWNLHRLNLSGLLHGTRQHRHLLVSFEHLLPWRFRRDGLLGKPAEEAGAKSG